MTRSIIVLCGVMFMAVASAADVRAQSQERCGLRGFPAPELCARAGLDTIPASYLFVVDESGSMQPSWSGVVGALAQFAGAVPDGSELDVRLFSTTMREVIPATRSDIFTRQVWASQLRSLPPPRGEHTDLGVAVRGAIQRIGAAPADQLQFVFFLTDGIHDPGPSSPFARKWDESWDRLAAEARQLASVRLLRLGIVRLSATADVGFPARVFPNAVVTDAMNTRALQQWFANLTGEAAVSKLHLLLERDLGNPAAVITAAQPVRTFAERSTTREVQIASGRRFLTTVFPAGTEFSLRDGGTIVLPDTVRLEPGEQRTVSVRIRDRAYLPILPPGVIRRNVIGSDSADALLEPQTELALIGASTRDTAAVEFDIELAGGGMLSWPIWLLAAAVLIACSIYLIVRVRWGTHRAYLTGRVIVRHSPSAGDPPAEETVIFSGKRLSSYTVTHPDGRSSVQLYASSERGRTAIYAEPAGQTVQIAGRALNNRTQINRVTRFETESGEITFLPN